MEYPFVQILGIRFFDGDVDQAVAFMIERGGFLIAPAGTCFRPLTNDAEYREAVTHADIAIPDSGGMVVLWKCFRGHKLNRISGLKFLQRLVARLFAEKCAKVLWILPDEKARTTTSQWLNANNFPFAEGDLYIAPRDAPVVEDRQLLSVIESRKPAHIVVGIGSGPQEKLGYYLRENLSYRPAIHCIGAALGFLTGDRWPSPIGPIDFISAGFSASSPNRAFLFRGLRGRWRCRGWSRATGSGCRRCATKSRK